MPYKSPPHEGRIPPEYFPLPPIFFSDPALFEILKILIPPPF